MFKNKMLFGNFLSFSDTFVHLVWILISTGTEISCMCPESRQGSTVPVAILTHCSIKCLNIRFLNTFKYEKSFSSHLNKLQHEILYKKLS